MDEGNGTNGNVYENWKSRRPKTGHVVMTAHAKFVADGAHTGHISAPTMKTTKGEGEVGHETMKRRTKAAVNAADGASATSWSRSEVGVGNVAWKEDKGCMDRREPRLHLKRCDSASIDHRQTSLVPIVLNVVFRRSDRVGI